MARSSALKNNRDILSKNLVIFEDNIQILSSRLGGELHDFVTEIYIVRRNLDKVRTNCGFAKVFFDYFILLQEFHLFVKANDCLSLIDQNYTGYLALEKF